MIVGPSCSLGRALPAPPATGSACRTTEQGSQRPDEHPVGDPGRHRKDSVEGQGEQESHSLYDGHHPSRQRSRSVDPERCKDPGCGDVEVAHQADDEHPPASGPEHRHGNTRNRTVAASVSMSNRAPKGSIVVPRVIRPSTPSRTRQVEPTITMKVRTARWSPPSRGCPVTLPIATAVTPVAIQLVPTNLPRVMVLAMPKRRATPTVGDQHRSDEIDDRGGGSRCRLGEAAERDCCGSSGGRGEANQQRASHRWCHHRICSHTRDTEFFHDWFRDLVAKLEGRVSAVNRVNAAFASTPMVGE